MILTKAVDKKHSSRKFRPVIFFERGEALLHIWSKVSTAAMKELLETEECEEQIWMLMEKSKSKLKKLKDEGCGESKRATDSPSVGEIETMENEENRLRERREELFEIPVPDLLREFRNVFDFFYPDGILMSAMEREEVCELFEQWTQEQLVTGRSRVIFNGSIWEKVQTVAFSAFHSWFYDLMLIVRGTMSDRLINHVLLTTSHKPVDTDSTGPYKAVKMVPANVKLSLS